jgi:iron complex outermembrane receptor protein
MKKIVSIGFFTLLTFISFGKELNGVILDKESKKPLQFVQIFLVDFKTGTTTDQNGKFHLENVKQKKVHLQISIIGYKTIDTLVTLINGEELKFYLEQGHFELQELTISAPKGRLQSENIVSIEHKDLKELKQNSPVTLAEAISNIPGVDQNSTGVGIGKPVIRGLSGNRIVTYAQGIRIENQQWGDEHGLGIGDVGIESVEVIKGPSSLLYGSDALGGVLYFIDQRYAEQNSVESFIQSKFLSNTLGTINNVGVKINKGKIKTNLFGTFSSHSDYKTPTQSRVFNTRFDEKNLKASFGFTAKNYISNLRYSYLQNNFGIAEDATYSNSTERKSTLPFQTIDNHAVSFENIIFIDDSKLNLTLGYTNNYRKEFEDDTENQALGMKLNTATYNLKWYSPTYKNLFNFIVGSQGMLQDNKNNGEELLIPDAKTNDLGAFILGNITYKKLQFQGGVRIDFREINASQINSTDKFHDSYQGLNFSGGAVYKLNKIKLRTNISSGFRAPTISELLSDGEHEGSGRYEKGNTGLNNEKAIQIDFSLDYDSEHFNFSVNPFYNAIQNYTFLSPTSAFIDGVSVYEYQQSNAFLYGGEIGFHYHPHSIHWLHIESNLSTVIAEKENGEALPLIPHTKLNTTFSAEISHKGKVRIKNIYIQHIYKFKQERVGLFETNTTDYHLVNLGLNLEIKTKNNPIEVNLGTKNLLNTSYIDHLSRFKSMGIPNSGINFYVGVKISLIHSDANH